MKDVHIEPRWRGAPLAPTRSAMGGLLKYGMDLNDALKVLEEGEDCCEGGRKEGVFERCLRGKEGITKVVVAESRDQHNKRDCWAVVHVGRVRG